MPAHFDSLDASSAPPAELSALETPAALAAAPAVSAQQAHARLQSALRLNLHGQAQALLDLGADPRQPFAGGLTPLMVAARLGFGACVAMLLERSDLQARDPAGRSALALAAGGNASADVVGLLARACPAMAMERDDMGALPSSRAASFGKAECVWAILSALPERASLPPMARETASCARAGGWPALASQLEMAAEMAELEMSAQLAPQGDPSRL